MIPVATTKSERVNYVEEWDDEKPIRFEGPKQVEVTERPWDVGDEAARAIAAEEELGEGAAEDEHYAQHAMWFINPGENRAALCVFRPKGNDVSS